MLPMLDIMLIERLKKASNSYIQITNAFKTRLNNTGSDYHYALYNILSMFLLRWENMQYVGKYGGQRHQNKRVQVSGQFSNCMSPNSFSKHVQPSPFPFRQVVFRVEPHLQGRGGRKGGARCAQSRCWEEIPLNHIRDSTGKLWSEQRRPRGLRCLWIYIHA